MSKTSPRSKANDEELLRHLRNIDQYINGPKVRKCCRNCPIEEIEETTKIITINPKCSESEIESNADDLQNDDQNKDTNESADTFLIYETGSSQPQAKNTEDFINELQERFQKSHQLPNRETHRKIFKIATPAPSNEKPIQSNIDPRKSLSSYESTEGVYMKKYGNDGIADKSLNSYNTSKRSDRMEYIYRSNNDIGEPNKIDFNKFKTMANSTMKYNSKDDIFRKYESVNEASGLERAKSLIIDLVDKELYRLNRKSDPIHVFNMSETSKNMDPQEKDGKMKNLRKKGLKIISDELQKLQLLDELEN